jgi:transposase-like protein
MNPFKGIKEGKITEFNVAVFVMIGCPHCKEQDEYLIYNPGRDSVEFCTSCEKKFKVNKFTL